MASSGPRAPEKLEAALREAHRQVETEHHHREQLAPREINNGFCRLFAQVVVEVLPEDAPVRVWSDGLRHTWIEYEGAYYDAERRVRGAQTVGDLPFYSRSSKAPPSKEQWLEGIPTVGEIHN